MKKNYLILLLFYTSAIFAQTRTETFKTTFDGKNSRTDSSNYYSKPSLFKQNDLFPKKQPSSLLFLQTPTFNASALTVKYTPQINLTDNLYNQFMINDWSWISTSHTMNNYFGLGGVNMVGANYNMKLGNFSVLSAGIFASKYNLYNNFGNSSGLNGNLRLRLSDRVFLNTFGQYSIGGAKNGIPPYLSTLYPNSFYGGSFEFKVTDKWGIITGAEREFDVLSRKWVTRPFIMPVFYGH
jgi:hypothetical protein